MKPVLVAYLWVSLLAAVAWGGTVYTHWGSSVCNVKGATLYSAGGEVSPLPQHNFDPVCAVCFVNSSATIMVPGTNVCPAGWRAEYKGILMSGYDSYPGSSEFICVDSKMEWRTGSDHNIDSRLLCYAAAVCGSLPCPPYQNNMILRCVVCSK